MQLFTKKGFRIVLEWVGIFLFILAVDAFLVEIALKIKAV